MSNSLFQKILSFSVGNSPANLTKVESAGLLYMYLNDKNSSTLREEITLSVAGVHSMNKKLSYDGYDLYGNYYEVKPMNILSRENKRKKRLDGSGSYNDLTWARHRKYLQDNPFVLISGFVDGHLSYIFEVPYYIFSNKIEEKLALCLGQEDQKSKYLRSFKFTYKDWIDHNPKTIFITKIKKILQPDFYNKKFFYYLNKAQVLNYHRPIIRAMTNVV